MTGETDRRPPRLPFVLVSAALLLVGLVLLAGPGDSRAVLVVDDLAQLVLAAAACASLGLCARRASGRLRHCWAALSLGCASWAAGQAVWSWYELVLGRETPFPSVADVGFLGFPVCAAVALLLHPAGGGRADGRRRLLDGLTVAAALGLVSWSTALGAAVSEGFDDALASAVGIAYPAADLVVLTLVVLLLVRAPAARGPLAALAAGVAGIAVSDSAFLVLTSTGRYGADDHAVSLGWCLGFGLLALAPLLHSDDLSLARPASAPRRLAVLPYALVAVVALLLVAAPLVLDRKAGPVDLALGRLTVLLVLVRQFVTGRDNARLVRELAAQEVELRHQAFHDGLTGLANRALFGDRVAHALELHRRDRRPLTVLFCDLDDFKLVNDTLGHAGGDALLVQVAQRLRGALRSGDTLARLGGDEFAVLLEDRGDPLAVSTKVVDALRAPFAVAGSRVAVSASVGVTCVRTDVETPTADRLLAQADTAMYAAKRGGKGSSRAFEPGMELDELAEGALAADLEDAVRERRVELAFQPIVDLGTGRVEGVEALARWTRNGQPVPPDVFIPVAERTGLIVPLTALVLDLACAQAARWQEGGGPSSLRVGVNLSPCSITDPELPAQVADVLARHGLRGTALALEITETALLSDPGAARIVCQALREQGVHLSLDDFGVGYSSLAHLNALPLDSLKLDRAFLETLDTDERQARFTRAVLRLADDLGVEVIAEGVERREQLVRLQALGCVYAQGYLLGRPAPADELTALLRSGLLLGVPQQR